ncbi:MAG: XisH family protein [Bacteroidetes bacterium]|nr:XisH family protein [Bacteroidota bacterium]MCB0847012.1 XisH family protein [Bacteroidota bacterium]
MAKDIYHNQVKSALESEGWTITADPYYLKMQAIEYEVDLGAEKIIAASKDNHKIAIEIKSFLVQSPTYEMHKAIGQFQTYAFALRKQEPERILYLAVPIRIYEDFFVLPFIKELISFYNIKLIVFDPDNKKIVKWIN